MHWPSALKPARVPEGHSWQPAMVAMAVLGLGLGLTGVLTWGSLQGLQERTQLRFGERAHAEWAVVRGEVGRYQRGLARIQDFFLQRATVSAGEWHRFLNVAALNEEFPALCEVGYVHPQAGAVQLGVPEQVMSRVLVPDETGGPVLFPVLFHYAKSSCFQRSYGSDLTPLEGPFLNRLLEARDTGSPRISPPFPLPHTEDGRSRHGMMVFLPVYRGVETDGPVIETAPVTGAYGQRRWRTQNFRGAVFGVVEIDALLATVAARETSDVAFEILEGLDPATAKRINAFPPEWLTATQLPQSHLVTNLLEQAVGGSLLVRGHATSSFPPTWHDGRLWATGLLGLGFSGALAGLVFVQARARQTAESWAEELAVSRQLLREAQQHKQQICRDLHDRTIQALYGVGLGLSRLQRQLNGQPGQVEQLEHQLGQLDLVVSELRGFLREIGSGGTPTVRPDDAFNRLLADCQHSLSLQISYDIDASLLASFDAKQIAELMPIIRETLTNAVRHGGARQATVRLTGQPCCWRLEIEDSGRGFDPQTQHGGHGLKNLGERADLLGGTLHVHSQVGGPTIVCITSSATTPALLTA